MISLMSAETWEPYKPGLVKLYLLNLKLESHNPLTDFVYLCFANTWFECQYKHLKSSAHILVHKQHKYRSPKQSNVGTAALMSQKLNNDCDYLHSLHEERNICITFTPLLLCFLALFVIVQCCFWYLVFFSKKGLYLHSMHCYTSYMWIYI